MTNRAFLTGETINAIKATMSKVGPWALAYGAATAALTLARGAITPKMSIVLPAPGTAPDLSQIPHQSPGMALIGLVLSLCTLALLMGAQYGFTVMYLRSAMKSNQPDYSMGGFWYWFRKMFVKYLRMFWVLIPIIGFFFYLRSIVYYQLVSPLAILRKGDELKTSWQLVTGSWWRIFGNAILLALPAIVIWGFMAMNFFSALMKDFSQLNTLMFSPMMIAAQAFMGVYGILVFPIYTCTCYRVLAQEARAALTPQSPA